MKATLAGVSIVLLTIFGCEASVSNNATSIAETINVDGTWGSDCIQEVIPVEGSDDIVFYTKQTYTFLEEVAESSFSIFLVAGCTEGFEQFKYDMLGSYELTGTGDNSANLDLFISAATATYGSTLLVFIDSDCPGDDCFLPYPIDTDPVAGEMYDNLSSVDDLPATGDVIYDIVKLEDGALFLGDKGLTLPKTAEDRPTDFDDDSFNEIDNEAPDNESVE